MKLDITEVYFLSEVAKTANIKASDAAVVAVTLDKLAKEFDRLQKIQQKEDLKLQKA
jgi:hypothetical protein